MSFQTGLKRISAVFWGLIGIVTIFLAINLGNKGSSDGFGLLLYLIPIFLLHKLTCWVISGFFSD